MKTAIRFAPFIFLVTFACSSSTRAISYKATLLHPLGFTTSYAFGVSGGHQVGSGYSPATDYTDHALMWSGSADSAVDLNPAGFASSRILGISGTSQVGFAFNVRETRAMLWQGTAASVVTLHPDGANSSRATGVSGDTQVGSVSFSSGTPSYAVLWRGTAASVLNLNPSGFTRSAAEGVFGEYQVGHGSGLNTLNHPHALLWNGTATSAIDLHPDGFPIGSWAVGVGSDSQVGYAQDAPGSDHAILWHGTADSAVKLTPPGFSGSRALAVSGNVQVGLAYNYVNDNHAMVWRGTSASAIDLHPLLSGFGLNFRSSYATSIDENGTIVGYAVASINRRYAVMWTPVPEPNTMALCGIAVIGYLGRVRQRRTLSPIR